MKMGIDLGIKPIKCENKEGNDKLKDMHYKINDLMYDYSRKYISKELASQLILRLTNFGKELSEVEVTDRARPKKNELLSKLRETFKNVKQYYETYVPTDEDKKQALQTAKYQLSAYLNKKYNTLFNDDIITLLKANKEIYDFVLKPNDVEYKPFNNMQNELISMLTLQYELV